jgi:hypothetical protein
MSRSFVNSNNMFGSASFKKRVKAILLIIVRGPKLPRSHTQPRSWKREGVETRGAFYVQAGQWITRGLLVNGSLPQWLEVHLRLEKIAERKCSTWNNNKRPLLKHGRKERWRRTWRCSAIVPVPLSWTGSYWEILYREMWGCELLAFDIIIMDYHM